MMYRTVFTTKGYLIPNTSCATKDNRHQMFLSSLRASGMYPLYLLITIYCHILPFLQLSLYQTSIFECNIHRHSNITLLHLFVIFFTFSSSCSFKKKQQVSSLFNKRLSQLHKLSVTYIFSLITHPYNYFIHIIFNNYFRDFIASCLSCSLMPSQLPALSGT